MQLAPYKSDCRLNVSLFSRESSEQMIRNPSSSSTPMSSTPLSPVKSSFSGQSGVSSLKPGPLPPNLDDLKVEHLT